MDFEAPPPLAGALEEPPDMECDLRLTLDDDEEVSIKELEIPVDLPCTSTSPPPLMSPLNIKQRRFEEKPEGSAEAPPLQTNSEHSMTNGLSSEVGSMHTASFFEAVDAAGVSGGSRSLESGLNDSEAEMKTASGFDPLDMEAAGCSDDRDLPDAVVKETVTAESCSDALPEDLAEECINSTENGQEELADKDKSVPTQEEDDVDDDFGDFAGVDPADQVDETQPERQVSTIIPGSSAHFHEEPEDEWNAFSGEPEHRQEISEAPSKAVVSDEWNAFSASDEGQNEENWSADFGSFEGQSPEKATETKPSVPKFDDTPDQISCPVLDEFCDSMDLWNVDSEIGGDEAFAITELLDAEKPVNVEDKSVPLNRSFDLWFALRIVEDALALKFEWKGSEHGSNLYKTLRVDPNAIGRGSLPPLSTSTVLEPTPFTANGTTRRSVIISREEGAYGAKVVASGAANSTTQQNISTPSVAESPSIPQADFDWDQSDLTNPTKAGNRASSLLDVDFLSANTGGGSTSTISTLQKELDQLGLSTPSSQELQKPANQPSMLDMIMASATKSSKRNNRPPSELSLDARALHDQLPDIDFLRANMIMFPLGGNHS
ncbi:unnamed protein product [Nippostrongylus brasiliensis]|uniref:Clathrin_bdg domain-containing protein n=1 Tax=Nippostrongylus brasiliensis TaxID=27835 RepID=A0A0N4YDF5_NIPBR|nr:unnamed protein product [Nippostrongylus brasiliensis]